MGGVEAPGAPERRTRAIRTGGLWPDPRAAGAIGPSYAQSAAMYACPGPFAGHTAVRADPRPGTGVVVPAPDHHPARPVDYAALSAGWGAALGTVLVAARDKGEEPVRPAELIPLGVATFALSKLVSKERVDRWVREPFVEERPDGERRPKGRGLRYAVGELLTCTRCVGTWSALGLVALRVTHPREARVVNAVLGASAINDWTQAGFNWVCARSNAAQAGASEAEVSAKRVVEDARFGR
jgi:hypothetical protein